MTPKIALTVMLCLAGSASQAMAQAPRPKPASPPPPVANRVAQPDNTTATYGDWTYRCQQGVGTRVCEIMQAVQIQGQKEPVALVAVGRGEPYRLVVQLPPNVTLVAGVKLGLGEKDDGTAAVYQRCVPGGCFAEAVLSDEALARWRGFSEQGLIRFQDAGRREIALRFSFKGFPAAIEALLKN